MNGLYLGPENGGVTVHLKDVTSAFHGFDFSQTKRFQNYGGKENNRTQVGFSPLTCKKIGSNGRSRCGAADTGLYLFCQGNTQIRLKPFVSGLFFIFPVTFFASIFRVLALTT